MQPLRQSTARTFPSHISTAASRIARIIVEPVGAPEALYNKEHGASQEYMTRIKKEKGLPWHAQIAVSRPSKALNSAPRAAHRSPKRPRRHRKRRPRRNPMTAPCCLPRRTWHRPRRCRPLPSRCPIAPHRQLRKPPSRSPPHRNRRRKHSQPLRRRQRNRWHHRPRRRSSSSTRHPRPRSRQQRRSQASRPSKSPVRRPIPPSPR